MSSPTFRSVASNTDTGGGNLVINKPTGTLDYAGGATCDWMLGCVSCDAGQIISTVPSGWIEIATGVTTFRAWVKRPSAEGGSYTWATTLGSAPRVTVGFIITIKDCDPNTQPTIGGIGNHAGSDKVTAPAVTPAALAALMLEIGTCKDATGDNVNATAPPGMRQRVDIQEDSSSGGADVQVHLHCMEGHVLPYRLTGDKVATLNVSKPNSGVLVFFYQVPLTAAPISVSAVEMLAEITYWDEAGAAEQVKKYSGIGVTFTGNEHYPARLVDGVEISQQAANSAAVGGIIATTISDLVLDNGDGELDEIYRRNLALWRTVVIKTINVTNPNAPDRGAGAVSNAATIFTGIVAGMVPELGPGRSARMRVQVSDLSQRLNTPLQAAVYDGTSGYGGGSEKKGLTKPALFGRCYNLLPEQLGTIGGKETFHLHSRAISDITAVYVRGVAQIDSSPTAPVAGEYRDQLANGAFDLGAQDGDVTCTAKGDSTGSYANQHGEIIDRALKDFGPLFTSGEVESSTFTAVDLVLPGEIGIHLPAGDRSSTRDFIRRVCESGGIWFAGGRNGKVRLSMAMPVPTDRIRLKETDVLDLVPRPLPASLQPAPHEITVETEKNWHQLQNIAGTVTGSTRRKLAGPGRKVTAASASLATRQKAKRPWPIVGLWFDDSDGQARADQIMAWIELGLVAFEVKTNRYLGQVELGMACEIDSYREFGLSGGFAGIVAGWKEVPAKRELTLFLIG